MKMDHANVEMEVIEKSVADATSAQVCELNDLQLAYVGGGHGEATPG
jgi:hypothetical protein